MLKNPLKPQPLHGGDCAGMPLCGAFVQHSGPRLEADAGVLSEGIGLVVIDIDAGFAHEDAVKIGRYGQLGACFAVFGIGDDEFATEGDLLPPHIDPDFDRGRFGPRRDSGDKLFERRAAFFEAEWDFGAAAKTQNISGHALFDRAPIQIERHALKPTAAMAGGGIVGVSAIGEADIVTVALPLACKDGPVARIPEEGFAIGRQIFDLCAMVGADGKMGVIAQLLGEGGGHKKRECKRDEKTEHGRS